MKCEVCGTEAEPGAAFCDNCGAVLTARKADGARDAADPPEALDAPVARFDPHPPGGVAPAPRTTAQLASPAQLATLPGTPLVLGDGEKIWRTYRVVRLRRPELGEGLLFVTDARVVFYARARGRGTQRPSALVQQTRLDSVTGVSAYVTHRISLGWFVLAVITGLFVVGSILTLAIPLVIFWGLLFAGTVWMLVQGAAKKGSVGVQIQGSSSDQSSLSFGQFGEQRGYFGTIVHSLISPVLGLLGVYTAFDVLLGFPGQDAEKVVSEIGALVFDMQSRGSLAAGRWGVPTDG
ncbi:zinc ribbon domain-containing protein [Sinomonas albida]|uniref:zinc ribbon domain-containing protein n=1 Tax=Sinomonas albida TaxID=369942 RepID=UPI00301B0392